MTRPFDSPLRDHLLAKGFEETWAPYQMHNPSYILVFHGPDSYGFNRYSIENKRYSSTSFRGVILNEKHFDFIFMLIKEDYELTDEEKLELKMIMDFNSNKP